MTPIDLNRFSPLQLEEEEQDRAHLAPSTLSTDTFSFPCPILLNTPQNHGATEREYHHLHQQADKLLSIGGSSDHTLSCQSDKSNNNNSVERSLCDRYNREEHVHGSVKWMSSKMRLMRKMMSPDQINASNPSKSMGGHQDQQQLIQDSNSSSNSSTIGVIRVCSDCHTTKTPLWRSGPRGPKSLCNACGIRQRKARRAMGILIAGDTPSEVQKEKISDGERTVPYKKRCKFITSETDKKKKLRFDDIVISLSKNSSFQQVSPQDEKDAAILLMALSCGPIHG